MSNLPKSGQLKTLEGREASLLRLVELSVTLNSTLDVDALLKLITSTATELLNCEAASILLYDERNPRLYFAASTGSDPAELAKIPVPIDNSIAGTIFRTSQPMVINQAQQDPRHYPTVSDQLKIKIKSLLGVPMPIKDRIVGVLEAINKRKGDFSESDVAIFSVLAAHAAIAIENARLLHTLQRALDKVKETNQIKSNFLALASHELRTPLGIIIGYATFLQEGSSGELSDHANQVLNAATQMRSLLDQMSNLTLLQSEEVVLKQMKIPLQDLVNFAIDEVKYYASRRDLKLVLKLEENPLYILAEPQKIILAFVNLLNNAIRFSEDGAEIIIGVALQNKEATAWIKDKGKGIPADKLEKIFEEFYQIEPPNTRSYGGLGIGLTIAKGLIEAQDGRIWAESAGEGKGSTFKVAFPLHK